MICAVCGQGLVPLAQAPVEPDRHRWCSDQPGHYLPAGQVGVQAWVEPLTQAEDLSVVEIEARFQAARRAIRLRARA